MSSFFDESSPKIKYVSLMTPKKTVCVGVGLGVLTHKLIRATSNSSTVLAKGTGKVTHSVMMGAHEFMLGFKEGYKNS